MIKGIEFYEWYSMLQARKSTDKKYRNWSHREIYKDLETFFTKRKDWASVDSCHAEDKWYCDGQPYFKIWPAMCQALSNINIDIDSKHLHLPFETYEVRFPKSPSVREENETPAVKSLLVHRSFLPHRKQDGRDWTFIIHYQFDLPSEDEAMGYFYAMPIKDGESIEQQFLKVLGESRYYDAGYVPSPNFVHQIVRIAVGTAFFGTHRHEMIMPDIPKKYLERYERARATGDTKEQEHLEDKAKRLGHHGWAVGKEIDLPRPEVQHAEGEKEEGESRHLKFGHVRSGHMRLQPYGPRDHPHYELKFIAPFFVRPDLPFRPRQGYRLKDDILEKK